MVAICLIAAHTTYFSVEVGCRQFLREYFGARTQKPAPLPPRPIPVPSRTVARPANPVRPTVANQPARYRSGNEGSNA